MPAKKSAKKTSGTPSKKSAKNASKKKSSASEKKSPAAEKEKPKKAPAEKPATAKSAISSASVNLGHIFMLRPRVPTSFRQDDLRAAKQQLSEEGYESIPQAARAVAEKALELTHESGGRPKPNRRI